MKFFQVKSVGKIISLIEDLFQPLTETYCPYIRHSNFNVERAFFSLKTTKFEKKA